MAFYSQQQQQQQMNAPSAMTLLNKYFNEVAVLSNADKKKVVEFVQDVIHIILENCNELDYRIAIEPIKVGGYWSRLKVKRPDEFDLIVNFAIVDLVWTTNPAPRCTFRLKNMAKGELIMEDTKKLPDGLETYELCTTTTPLSKPPPGYVSINADVAPFSFQGVVVPFLVKRLFREKMYQSVSKFNESDDTKGRL